MTWEIPFLRTPFNYDRNAASEESGCSCPEPTLAKQSFADECDINTIVKRFGLSGTLPENLRAPTYDDFSTVYDFHTAMNAIAKAREAFDQLPPDVRYRFHNDPGAFVDFCSDDRNRPEAERLGLVLPKPVESPTIVETEAVAPPKPAAKGGGSKTDAP